MELFYSTFFFIKTKWIIISEAANLTIAATFICFPTGTAKTHYILREIKKN